jgi:hypothetical protein
MMVSRWKYAKPHRGSRTGIFGVAARFVSGANPISPASEKKEPHAIKNYGLVNGNSHGI